MGFSAKDLYEIGTQLKKDNQKRLSLYKTLEDVFWEDRFTGEIDKVLSAERKRPTATKILYNLFSARVKDRTNLLKAVPDIKAMSPPGMDDGPVWAEFMRRVILSYWENSRIHSMFELIGHYLSLYDAYFIMAVPDLDKKRPRIMIRHPGNTFLLPKVSYLDQYIAVFFIYELEGRQILADYPEASRLEIANTSGKYEFIEVWTEEERLFFANGKKIPGIGVKHEFGYIPGKMVVATPGGFYGRPTQSVALQELMNEHMILTAEERIERLNQNLVLYNAEIFPDEMPGRGAVIKVGEEGGKAEYMGQIQGDLNSMNTELEQIEMMFRKQEGWPMSRSAAPESAIWTERGIRAAQAPVSDDIAAAQDAIGEGLKYVDECCVKIEMKMFPSTTQVADGNVYMGAFKPKEPFSIPYIPKDDLIAEFKHRLEFSPFGDPATMNMIWLQRQGQGVVSLQTVREVLPGIDPAEEERRIKKERAEEMQMALAMQGAMGGGQPGAPPVPAEQMEDEFFAGQQGGGMG